MTTWPKSSWAQRAAMRTIGKHLMRYMREPYWAFSAASPRDAARLYAKTWRHHVANWRGASRDDESAFDVCVDTGAGRLTPVRLRAVGGDVSILYEVFAEQAYRLPDHLLPPASAKIVLDCGAHIGLTALYFAERYPNARVIAVEANPINFALLCQNVKANPRIVPIHAAVYSAAGTVKIGTSGPGMLHAIGSTGIDVPAVTLDGIRAQCGIETIDLLKIDIEGAEKEVFRAGIGSVRAIAAELHGDYTEDNFAADILPLRPLRRSINDVIFAV